jgi:zinc protease
MTLAVSGQVSATEVLAEARRLFGELPRGGRVVEPARPTPANPETRRVIEQAVQQAQILAGGIAPSMSHPDHAAVKVLSTILGGGMAGRLFVELRDRIRTDLVDAEELRRARGYLLGRQTMDRRTNERLAWYLAFYEVEEVGQDYPERYRKAVEAVTPAGVLRVAKQYLEKVTTVVLRPR